MRELQSCADRKSSDFR